MEFNSNWETRVNNKPATYKKKNSSKYMDGSDLYYVKNRKAVYRPLHLIYSQPSQ